MLHAQLLTVLASYSIFYFISIYYILVAGYSTSKAGLELLYYIPGLGGKTLANRDLQVTNRHAYSWCLPSNILLQRLPSPNLLSPPHGSSA